MSLELLQFWRAVQQANKACLADLTGSRVRKAHQSWAEHQLAVQRRHAATESLRVFRPLEKALRVLIQLRSATAAQTRNNWQAFASRKLAAILPLCRQGLVHPAYRRVWIPVGIPPFSTSFVFSASERRQLQVIAKHQLQDQPLRVADLLAPEASPDITTQMARRLSQELSPETVRLLRNALQQPQFTLQAVQTLFKRVSLLQAAPRAD